MTRACAVLVLVAATATADASPGAGAFLSTPKESTWLMVGGNVGAIVGHGDTRLLGGVEASVAHIHENTGWYGGYVDIVADKNHDGARLSLGGEAGFSVLAIDAGVVLDFGGQVSVRVRPELSIGVVTLYLGPVIPLSGADRDSWTELGLLVKLPHRF